MDGGAHFDVSILPPSPTKLARLITHAIAVHSLIYCIYIPSAEVAPELPAFLPRPVHHHCQLIEMLHTYIPRTTACHCWLFPCLHSTECVSLIRLITRIDIHAHIVIKLCCSSAGCFLLPKSLVFECCPFSGFSALHLLFSSLLSH
jgi:hypothetical protein